MMFLFDRFGVKPGWKLKEDEYLNEAGIPMCKRCHTPRQADIPVGKELRRVTALCRCQMEERDQEEAQRKVRERQDTIARNRSIGLTDPFMRKHTFMSDEGYNPREMSIARNYVRNWEEMRKRSEGLLIWGDVGTGKSYIADCIGNALLEQGVTVLITNFSRLLNRMSELQYGDKNGFIDSLNSFELLILDDFGVERDSAYVREQCFNIIDSRCRSGLPMIVTTNMSLKEMKNETDMGKRRIFDRLLEHNVLLNVNGQNIRKIHARQTMKDGNKYLCSHIPPKHPMPASKSV